MEEKTFSVPNISCKHCVATIKNELSEIEGVDRVEGDPENRKITVWWKAPATQDRIRKMLQEINYPAEP